jgi:hypothetical protein
MTYHIAWERKILRDETCTKKLWVGVTVAWLLGFMFYKLWDKCRVFEMLDATQHTNTAASYCHYLTWITW